MPRPGAAACAVAPAAGQVTFVLDQDGRVARWHASAARISGRDAQQAIGRPLVSLLSEEDCAAGLAERALAMALQDGMFHGACTLLREDGSCFVADLVVDAVFEAAGAPAGFIVAISDATRQRQEVERHARMVRIDFVTGIANRTSFMEKLEEACARLRRRGDALQPVHARSRSLQGGQ